MKYFAILLSLLYSTLSFSQTPDTFYLFGGGTNSMTPFSFLQDYNMGLSGGVGYLHGYRERIDLCGEITYSRKGFKEENLLFTLHDGENWKGSGGGLNMVSFLGYANLKFAEEFKFIIGCGYYHLFFTKYSATYQGSSWAIGNGAKITYKPESISKPGINYGLSLKFGHWGGRGMVHNILTSGGSTRIFEFGVIYFLNR